MVDYFSRFGIPKGMLHDLDANRSSDLCKEMFNYFGKSQLQ